MHTSPDGSSPSLPASIRTLEGALLAAFEAAQVGLALVVLEPHEPSYILLRNATFDRFAREFTGGPADSVAELLAASEYPQADDDRLLMTALLGRSATGIEAELDLPGVRRWVRLVATPLPGDGTEAMYAVVRVEDVTLRRQAELAAEEASARDPLTGLSTRPALLQRLTELTRARDNGEAGPYGAAIMYCDLTQFAELNQTHGRTVGDAVLTTCAGRLSSLIRDTDEVYRVGDDQFVVLLAVQGRPDLDPVVQRIKTSITAPIIHDGGVAQTGVAVGWTMVDGHTQDVERILAAADAQMYIDKRSARSAAPPRRTRL